MKYQTEKGNDTRPTENAGTLATDIDEAETIAKEARPKARGAAMESWCYRDPLQPSSAHAFSTLRHSWTLGHFSRLFHDQSERLLRHPVAAGVLGFVPEQALVW